ncbi:MAG: hypothetical protein RL281_665, partial [Pseudomonadota bacterium]
MKISRQFLVHPDLGVNTANTGQLHLVLV